MGSIFGTISDSQQEITVQQQQKDEKEEKKQKENDEKLYRELAVIMNKQAHELNQNELKIKKMINEMLQENSKIKPFKLEPPSPPKFEYNSLFSNNNMYQPPKLQLDWSSFNKPIFTQDQINHIYYGTSKPTMTLTAIPNSGATKKCATCGKSIYNPLTNGGFCGDCTLPFQPKLH